MTLVGFLVLALTLSDIKTHYQGVKQFAGEAEQVKTSPLLLRPLKSTVKVGYDHGLLSWQPAGQEAWQVKFGPDGKPVFLGAGAQLKDLPPDAREKLDQTMGLVRDLFTMDPRLEQNFDLALDHDRLTVKPKPQTKVFFTEVTLDFKPDMSLDHLTFLTADDKTVLTFHSMKISR